MKFNRREFLKGWLATLGFLALPGGLFAAPAGFKPKKKPNLVFGVVSDTHMCTHYDGVRFYEHYGNSCGGLGGNVCFTMVSWGPSPKDQAKRRFAPLRYLAKSHDVSPKNATVIRVFP